ncbi:uncharacterized protein LOC128245633 [Mya arenaria]|uniref:uncharacterized protein LOC128245633 n=1 Tax=Mya arenaria TaxID=6604 RepID=UPI0022DEEC00|nr:uncharacterized protein LOC128245633 [Mya arenaria]
MDNKIFITMNIVKEDMDRYKFLNLNSWRSNGPLPKEALLKLVVGTNTLICTPTDDVDMDVLNAAGPSLQAICTISPTTDHVDVNECRKRNVAVVDMPYATVDNAYDLTLNILERLNAHQLMIRSPDVSPSKTYSDTLCPVCFDRERNVAFQCNHSACDRCARRLTSCFMCREPVLSLVALYNLDR